MIEKMAGLPLNVLGIRASGKVNKENIQQVLLPALDELSGRTGKLNYLLVLDTKAQDFTLGAWWKDMIAGLKHFTDWNRIAVVTDQKAVEVFTDLFELAIPGNSKGFTHEQLEEAKLWVAKDSSKPLSPKAHALIDYALAGSLLVLPSVLKMNKTARLIYAAEAAVLLPYIAVSDHPVALNRLIPFKTHEKIDTFNVAQFAAQSLLPALRKNRRELIYNIVFTALASLNVLLTDWDGETV